MTSIRLGIVGLGNIGRQHLGHIHSGAAGDCLVTAVATRQAPQDSIEGVQHFTDYRQLVASGLCDGVLVATPTLSHREIGECVLDAGLHLLMEKPIGLSVGDGEALLQRTREGQVFGLMLNQRVAPVFATMKQLLDDGLLGPLQRTHWTMTNWFRPEVYFQVSDWRATWRGEGGGLLVNQCIHNLDIFQWLTGMPESVHGFCGFGKYHDIEVEDEATAFFSYPGGATGVFIGSTGEAPGVNRLDIVGDAGMLSFDGERLVHTRNTPPTAQYNRETRDMFGQPASEVTDLTPTQSINQHGEIIRNFCAAIRGEEVLIAPAADGLDSLGLANGILQSAWAGQPVSLPLDSAAYQAELDKRLATSALRTKAEIDVNVDMEASYR